MSEIVDPEEELPPEFTAPEVEHWSADLADRVARRKRTIRWVVAAAAVSYVAFVAVTNIVRN